MGKDRAICLTHGFSYVRFRGVSDIRLGAMSGRWVSFADDNPVELYRILYRFRHRGTVIPRYNTHTPLISGQSVNNCLLKTPNNVNDLPKRYNVPKSPKSENAKRKF